MHHWLLEVVGVTSGLLHQFCVKYDIKFKSIIM